MKRLYAICAVVLAFLPVARADTAGFYINNSVVNIQPPVPAPQIDATNFINRNLFLINTGTGGLPYDFSNTENFTNNNIMSSPAVGFRFDTAVTATGLRKRAKNFANAGPAVNPANASVTAGTKLLIDASNVVNRGLLQVGALGQLSISGDIIDGDRGSFQSGSGTSVNESGIYDNYWWFGTNRMIPEANLNAALPVTPIHTVESLQAFSGVGGVSYFYANTDTAFAMFPPGVTAFVSQIGGDLAATPPSTNRTVSIVFVYNTNSSITTTVRYFDYTQSRLGVPVIEWMAVSTNSVTGVIYTNLLYLEDNISQLETNEYVEHLPNGVPPPTYAPMNYSFTRTPPLSFIAGVPGATYTTPAPTYWGTNPPVIITNAYYTAYSVRLSAQTFEPTASITETGLKKLPGRIDLDADKSLALSHARIGAPNYVRVNSTNHFVGATNVSISAPIADIYLASTNGYLDTMNLLLPTIPRFTGRIDLYSSVWTNSIMLPPSGTNTNSATVIYQVLYVNSHLSHLVSPLVNDLVLKSTNVVVSASFNITNNLFVEADSFTVATNGNINLTSPLIDWSTGVRSLKYFTNYGSIAGGNAMYFLGSGQSPDGSDLPYETFFNNGVINSPGNTVMANYLVNRGTINASSGSIDLNGYDVLLLPSTTTNVAMLRAPGSDILISAQNLTLSNQLILPGRSLSLWVSGHIDDGSPTVTNRMAVGDGFNLFVKPATGHLLNTVVTNNAMPYQTVPISWAAEDRGNNSAGYTNNAALGRLVLNGATNSFFLFSPVNASNAMYLGTLELKGAATMTNAAGDFVSIGVNSGMKIYFAYLVIDGVTVSPTLLDGKNGGAFNYVSTYTGPSIQSVDADQGDKGDGFSLNLSVSSGNPPGTAVLVSWNTVAGATNRLFYKNSLTDSTWHLLGEFISSADGRVEYPDAVTAGSRIYSVQIDRP